MSEKYFVFSIEDGHIEPVIWFKTLKQARKKAEDWKRKYPTDTSICIGKILFELKEEKEAKPT